MNVGGFYVWKFGMYGGLVMFGKSKRQTIGQLVDELADKYFAAGMDAFFAQVRAITEVYASIDATCKFISDIISGSAAPSEEVQHEN